MTWVFVKSVVRRVASVFSSRGRAGTAPSIGSHGPAPNTEPKSKPDGERTLRLIERRALRKSGNTDKATMANYRRVHSALSRGNSLINLSTIFRAGFVRRWHTNPDLVHTIDRLDGHHGRTARLMLALWPETSAEALRYALTHDDGEIKVGDVPATHKGAHVTCDAEDRARYCIWGPDPDLTAIERRRVKLCDRLDAYMWARHHAPHVMGGDGWPEARRWIMREAERLGVYADVVRAI